MLKTIPDQKAIMKKLLATTLLMSLADCGSYYHNDKRGERYDRDRREDRRERDRNRDDRKDYDDRQDCDDDRWKDHRYQ
ncbi:hypothetical protein NY406_02685 [Chlorobaculum sp. MV4-Y]|jgi:hypothetical protein|uniref:hypothetical protein n=1 Tax=Chlorobaculum sp. MV4-Y TaxID=2976335 RepID=UPI0021AF3FF5|nr:hypothetical protein [Chlorobaculum sp. MV4-Y]UWX58200.1 hypothetical protein NY406_02685 [Chlorobaculum sp. MV4-Y]